LQGSSGKQFSVEDSPPKNRSNLVSDRNSIDLG